MAMFRKYLNINLIEPIKGERLMIALFDVDDTLQTGVSDWKHGGPLSELLFPNDSALRDAFTAIVSTPEGRLLNRKTWIREAFRRAERLCNESVVEKIATEFGYWVGSEMVKHIQLDSDAEPVLEYLNTQGVPCYVISGASHANVTALLKMHGIYNMLDGVYGFGWSKSTEGQGLGKSEAALDILKNQSLNEFPPNSFVVGDGESDLNLAKKFTLNFFAIPTSWNGWKDTPPQYKRMRILSSLGELKKYV